MPRTLPDPESPGNIAARLSVAAETLPDQVAVVEPSIRDYRPCYDTSVTFRQLEADVNCIARGLVEIGVTPGMRLALLVKPCIDFYALVFALFRAGAAIILIDPGMGQKLLRCLSEAEPRGFVAIPAVQAVRALSRKFPRATLNVTVGRRWFWGGTTLERLRERGAKSVATLPAVQPDDPAAIIFTTGSTGPPKGVLYSHRNFDTQVVEIRDRYGIEPGEIDLPGFPLFGLFNAAMGVTTVIPQMDFTRPAKVPFGYILKAVRLWRVTQAFGSPAMWNKLSLTYEQWLRDLETKPDSNVDKQRLPEYREDFRSIRRVLSAGAPVPAEVLMRTKAMIHPEGEIHTPYGATEALPVASISASEVLGETAERTKRGAGVCVGKRFSRIEWRVVRIVDGPIATIEDAESLPPGEIGELIVRGPQVTREYVTRTEWNAKSKIADGETFWHRMGDAGYLDEQDRFWFCGRVAHRVVTAKGTLHTACCEEIFNQQEKVTRTALVGVGPTGKQTAVIVVEQGAADPNELRSCGKSNPLTESIEHFLSYPKSFPVDIRHNAKINRDFLAEWADGKLVKQGTA